jgi:hypothetical protein
LTQFRFQPVSNTSGVRLALQRSTAPLDRLCAQFLVGLFFRLHHGHDCAEVSESYSDTSRSSIQ